MPSGFFPPFLSDSSLCLAPVAVVAEKHLEHRRVVSDERRIGVREKRVGSRRHMLKDATLVSMLRGDQDQPVESAEPPRRGWVKASEVERAGGKVMDQRR